MRMKIGISLPQLGPQASPENLIRVAERAEQLGYDSVWVLERLMVPLNPQEPYPASPDGKLPDTYKIVFDPIETLTFVAARTSKVRLGTSVLVLPYHTPIELARRLATLDVLSNGRVSVGVGAGWSHDEFEAVGTPFNRRGARSDEFLQAMIDLWTDDPVKFDGEFYHVAEAYVGPKPVQKPHPPIYVAGFGDFALKRAVRYGNGWNPSGVPNFEWFEAMLKQLYEIAGREGRETPEVVVRAFTLVLDKAAGEGRGVTMGSLDEIKQDIGRMRDLGVTELIHSPPEIGFTDSPDIEPGLALMERLIEISR